MRELSRYQGGRRLEFPFLDYEIAVGVELAFTYRSFRFAELLPPALTAASAAFVLWDIKSRSISANKENIVIIIFVCMSPLSRMSRACFIVISLTFFFTSSFTMLITSTMLLPIRDSSATITVSPAATLVIGSSSQLPHKVQPSLCMEPDIQGQVLSLY